MSPEQRPEPKRVMLVENDVSMIRSVRSAVQEDQRLHFVGYLTGRTNLDKLLDEHAPDVALVDLLLAPPGRGIAAPEDAEDGFNEGLAAIALISEHSPHTKIIGFSNYFIVRPALAKQALTHGADAIIAKDCSPSDWWAWTNWLCAELHGVLDGWWRPGPEVARLLQDQEEARRQTQPDAPLPLTSRQLDVLRCLASGMTDDTIAQQLCIEAGAVRGHIANIKKRLQLRYRWQVINEARRRGMGGTST